MTVKHKALKVFSLQINNAILEMKLFFEKWFQLMMMTRSGSAREGLANQIWNDSFQKKEVDK